MSAMASQITSLTIVYSTVYSGADQSKHQSSESLAFVWAIHRGPVNSPHKWPVTRKMLPFDDVIMHTGDTAVLRPNIVWIECALALPRSSASIRMICGGPFGVLVSPVSWDMTEGSEKLPAETKRWNRLLVLLSRLLFNEAEISHDDVIKWKHFLRYWPFVRGIHRWPVNSLHKGQWRGTLMFSLISAVNKRLSKRSWGWWFETPSRPLRRHCNDNFYSTFMTTATTI